MTEQTKARDISAGVATMGRQQLHQGSLGGLHLAQGPVQPLRPRGAHHRGGEQHTRADGPAQQQGIPRTQGTLGPMAGGGGEAIDGEGEPEASAIATLQGVPPQQARAQGVQHGAHAGEGVQKQFLLQGGGGYGQGDHHLGALDIGATGPKIAAGMERGEASVEPGVAHKGGKAIHALQQALAAGKSARHGGVLRRGRRLVGALHGGQPGQGGPQGLGGELGGTAAAGHGGLLGAGHRPQGGEAVQKALVELVFPAPEQEAGAKGEGPPKGQGPRGAAEEAAISQQLECQPLGAPGPERAPLKGAAEIGGKRGGRTHGPHP